MKRAFHLIAALVAGLSPLAVGTATASDGAASAIQSVIETRRAGFKKMGAAMKAISEQLKSDAPDLARITAAAQAISSNAREQPAWFPAGSGPESGLDTDALPHIWQDASKFTTLSSQLGVESQSFATAVAGNDLAAVRSQFKVLAEVCSGCHKSFRAD